GYETLGHRLLYVLAKQSQLTLLIACRSSKHVQNFCKELNSNLATVLPLYFGRNYFKIKIRR
ncbi:unnamed protein product, partial [Rotaria sordida]